MPGQSIHSLTFDAVQVRARQRMSCFWALHIAAKARWLTGLKIIYGHSSAAAGGAAFSRQSLALLRARPRQ